MRRSALSVLVVLAATGMLAACGSGPTTAGPAATSTTGPGPRPTTTGSCPDDTTATSPPHPTSTWDEPPTLGSTTAGSTVPTTGPAGSPSSATTVAPTTGRPTTTVAPTTRPRSTSAPTTAPSTTGSTPTATATTVPSSDRARALYRGSTARAVVALTFDAGSDCGYAEQILDLLAAERITATFGMTGRWAEGNPALVRRMVDEGHQLLNHTYSHPSFTGASTGAGPLSAADRRTQLDQADTAVAAITGVSMKPWFRPPYGDIDDSVNADLAAAGYRWNVLWTVDSLGWKGLSAADIEARCLERAGNGVIYLFHVGSQSLDAEALPAIIAGLRRAGYGFVTVADMV